MVKIERVRGREILDSRGNPTLAAEVRLSNGIAASAKVPSGASTGKHEARELRDGDPARHGGKGVLKAVRNIDEVLGPAVCGYDPGDQAAIDRSMIVLDATPDKSRLGANAILGVSCAVARAAAMARGLPLWRHLQGERTASVPAPMVNVLSGGLHAGGNFEFQDFLIIPENYPTLADSLEAVVQVHRAAYVILRERGCILTGVADEGGWGPVLESNAAALDVLAAAIARAGACMTIAIDAAASHFHESGVYRLRSERRTLSSTAMTDLLEDWVNRYRIASIEDGLAEDDWEGWRALTSRLGSRIQLVGDDLFATNLTRLERGIREGAANSVLVKMNQIGTLTETFAVIDRAREAGYGAVISARSGETEDDFLADLAVASGAGRIKIGSVTRSERLAKYNRLLEIERDRIISN
jgi:enolase